MAADRPVPYRVELSGHVRDQLRALLRTAAAAGRWAEASAAAASLQQALAWVPETVAEPAYLLPPLGRVHAGSHGPIQLRFAVNDERRYVVVAFVRLNPPDHD